MGLFGYGPDKYDNTAMVLSCQKIALFSSWWQRVQGPQTRLYCPRLAALPWHQTAVRSTTLKQKLMYAHTAMCTCGLKSYEMILRLKLFDGASENHRGGKKFSVNTKLRSFFLSQQSSQWPPFSTLVPFPIIGARAWAFYWVFLCKLFLSE